jgi:hypothetical protein
MSNEDTFLYTGNNFIDAILWEVQEAVRLRLTPEQWFTPDENGDCPFNKLEDAAERAADAWDRGVLCGKCGKNATLPKD